MKAVNTDEKRPDKEQLYRLFARVANAMANPHRLELLDLLAQASRTVEELAQEAHMSIANTSQHLQRLKQARLVLAEREGLFVRYRLADPAVARLWLELRTLAERQIPEVKGAHDAYRRRPRQIERISINELLTRLYQGDVVLLDVRPRVEYEAGHLPTALSIPLEELERRLNELPLDKTVVAYCRGPYCVYADEALELLAGQGYRLARLEEGVTEWQIAGYTLEGPSL